MTLFFKQEKNQTQTPLLDVLLLWKTFHRARLEHGHVGIKLEKQTGQPPPARIAGKGSGDKEEQQLLRLTGHKQDSLPETRAFLTDYNLSTVTFKVVRDTSKIPRACEAKY